MLKLRSTLLGISLSFLIPLMLSAGNVSESPNFSCELPAPNNLRITGYTSTSISLAWDSLVNPLGYEVQVFEMSGFKPIQVHVVTGTSITIIGLAPDTDYHFEVAGICQNQERGEWSGIEGRTGIVLDLVVDYHQVPTLQEINSDPGNPGSYTLDWEPGKLYWFELHIPGGGYSRYEFSVPPLGSLHAPVAKQGGTFPTYPKGLDNNDNWQDPIFSDLQKVRICYSISNPATTGIGELTMKRIDIVSEIKLKVDWKKILPQYSFHVYEEEESGDRNESDTALKILEPELQVAPNPFNSEIQITGLITSSGTNLQLFRPDGSMVQTFITTAQKYSIPTYDLAPGIYFLQVGSGKSQKTFKLVKTH